MRGKPGVSAKSTDIRVSALLSSGSSRGRSLLSQPDPAQQPSMADWRAIPPPGTQPHRLPHKREGGGAAAPFCTSIKILGGPSATTVHVGFSHDRRRSCPDRHPPPVSGLACLCPHRVLGPEGGWLLAPTICAATPLIPNRPAPHEASAVTPVGPISIPNEVPRDAGPSAMGTREGRRAGRSIADSAKLYPKLRLKEKYHLPERKRR